MEKYIDALKLGAKRKAEAKPIGLKKRKLAKEPKKAKITAEEYLAKVKATKTMKAKKGKKGKKQLTDAQKLQYEKQIAELRKSIREQQKAKEKIATQSETAKAVKKITEEKEKEKLLKLKAILGTDATKAKEKKAIGAPLTLLDTDLTFKKLTKDEQKLLKSKLKTAGDKEEQLLAVEKFIALPKTKKESFVFNLLPTPKGTIEEVDLLEELKARKAPGAGAEPVGAELFGKTKKQRDEEAEALALALGKEVRASPVKESLFTPAPAKLRTQAVIDAEAKKAKKLEKAKKDAEARVELEKELDKEIEEGLKKKIKGKKIEEEEEEVEPKIRLSKKQKRKAKAKEKAEAEEAGAQASPDDQVAEVLDRVNTTIDLYSQNNEDRKDFLRRKWTNSIPQIEKAIADDLVITNDMIRTKTEEFLEEYEKIQYLDLDVPEDVKAKLPKPAPQPEAFIPEAQLKKGQQELDEQEADAIEKAFAQAQKEVEIPDSALEAIDRVNTQNAKEGKPINVLEGKTAKPAITKRETPLPEKRKPGRPPKPKAPAPAPTPAPAPAPEPAPEPLIAITPTQSETDKDIAQVAQATVEADPTIAPADQNATASATAEGFASGLKKVKKMHGKIIHDKVVKVMASQAGIQKGLNKVKKMHGGAMHDRVKGMLMKKFPSFFF